MNRDDPLFETAILGHQAEAFVASDVGRYLIARAEYEAAEANAALKSVFPLRWRRIMQLQNEIYRAESVQRWLMDAITDGAAAERAITGDDNG